MACPSERRRIFVFGSNLAGHHGKGAAKYAHDTQGAVYGIGKGLQGNSYAIPTKDRMIQSLPLAQIQLHVEEFIRFARLHQELLFEVTPIGCGLAGFKPAHIGPMFNGAPDNVLIPDVFDMYISTRTHVASAYDGPLRGTRTDMIITDEVHDANA